jgi:hypothetical protein
MNTQSFTHDKRTVGVEKASYRFAFLVISTGLLISVAYRSFALHQKNWDLLFLVIMGGITALYRGTHKVLPRRWMMATMATVSIAGLFIFVFMLIR